MSVAASASPLLPRLPRPGLLALIAAAWLLALVAQFTGRADAFHHDALLEGGLPLWAALGLFLLVWQVHVAAMMLPSSLPLIRLFARAAHGQARPGRANAAFLAGYLAVWTGFGALAFLGDAALHWAVDQVPWLAQRPWLVVGSVLLLAGLFQFSTLKERCLRECRHPAVYLQTRYRRGINAAFRLGIGHGLFCLGCCWALMLVVFGAGVANLLLMAPLALVMLVEKTARDGRRLVAPLGVGLVALGVLALAHPLDFVPPLPSQ